ncbi:MAG TPA: hypothetical protein VG309_10210 [Rhizomicrobium sp.]|jgi:hypothetical protein|nr:hypothetical protein [Rhizomicrobium sp.]
MAVTNDEFGKQGSNWEARNRDQGKEISVDDARQAVPLGHIRYVLGISLALVVVLFAIIYFSYSHTW